MNKKSIFQMLAVGMIALSSCQQKSAQKVADAKNDNDSTAIELTTCQVKVGDLTFTHALNGADTCVSVREDGKLESRAKEGDDFFIDPNKGKLTNQSLPILLKEVDNTKPFTLQAKVTPEFTKEGLYNAADLFVYANDTLWQKLAFEQDEYGNHRVVSVRTKGTSDDNNHDKQTASTIYLKISSDTHTIASYYSLDKKAWHMVRLYKNYYPAKLYLGIASQCPQKGACKSIYEELELNQNSVSDFRMGE